MSQLRSAGVMKDVLEVPRPTHDGRSAESDQVRDVWKTLEVLGHWTTIFSPVSVSEFHLSFYEGILLIFQKEPPFF